MYMHDHVHLHDQILYKNMHFRYQLLTAYYVFFFHAEFRSSEIGDSESRHYPVHKARSGVIWSCCQVCWARPFRICEEKGKYSNTVYN